MSRSRVKAATTVFAASAVFSACHKPAPEPNFEYTDASLNLPISAPERPVRKDYTPEAAMRTTYVQEALMTPRVVLVGDSIVHYSDELVSRRLAEVLNSQDDSASNATVVGVTKGGQLINGWIGYQFDKYVVDPNYNIIVLQGGVNDIGWYGKTGYTKIRQEAFDKLLKRFKSMVKQAEDNKKVIVLVTVSPWKGQPFWNEVGQDYTEQMNEWMKSQSGRIGVYVADTYSELATKDPGCENEKDMLARGYRGVDVQHTNDSGRKLIGEVIADALGSTVSSFTPPEKTKLGQNCPP